MRAIPATVLASSLLMLATTPVLAGNLPDGAHRMLTVEAIGGSEPVTVPVRYDDRGDEEVYVPEHGWERCVYSSCTYTVRACYFDRWEPGSGNGRAGGRGILGLYLGLD
ncbi:MAG: hypothetical protein U1E49_02295 [Hyphomicrobiaceae bacterium]